MFSMFRKGPKFADRDFRELAVMLTREDGNPTFHRERLAEDKLDLSLASLGVIDEYLDTLHGNPPEGQDYLRVVLRCGAYVGETMRALAPGRFHWVAFEEAEKYSDFVRDLGKSLGTVAVLWGGNDDICFPLAKVGKYIENGREDSVHFFASAVLDR